MKYTDNKTITTAHTFWWITNPCWDGGWSTRRAKTTLRSMSWRHGLYGTIVAIIPRFTKLQPRRPTQATSGPGWPNRFLGLSQCLNLDLDIFEFNWIIFFLYFESIHLICLDAKNFRIFNELLVHRVFHLNYFITFFWNYFFIFLDFHIFYFLLCLLIVTNYLINPFKTSLIFTIFFVNN